VTTLTIAAQDSTTMLGRELKHTLRFPLLLVGLILVPVEIRTLAEAGVPLARIKELLAAGPGQFAAAIAEIDRNLAERATELLRTRERIAQLSAGDRRSGVPCPLPPVRRGVRLVPGRPAPRRAGRPHPAVDHQPARQVRGQTRAGSGPGRRPAGRHVGRRIVPGLGPAHRDRQAAHSRPCQLVVSQRSATSRIVNGAR
jgi:hypothetical protein